jgi:hypothetical protein
MKRLIVGLATTVLLSGGVAGVVGAGTAQADPDRCSTTGGCYKGPGMRWCPGDYVWPDLVATGWDLSVCHVYHYANLDNPNAGPNQVNEGPPPPTPPGLNFCPIPPWCP